MIAALSTEAVEQIAEVIQASDAQGKAPELYLILLFAGAVIVVLVYLMLRHSKSHTDNFVDYVKGHEKAEDARMVTMEKMASACHATATRHLEMVLPVINRCEAALRKHE